MGITQTGGELGITGLYVTEDPGAPNADDKEGTLKIKFGLGWSKAHSLLTGQTPAMKYNRDFMKLVLSDKAQIAKAVNATVIGLDEAPEGYSEFDEGVARKFVIVPHGLRLQIK